MRKFTLLFMSMFLMVGTMVAQDAAFELTSVSPSSDKPVTRVDNVTLVFTKNVTATMPEGGIAVVNNETKESIKLANIYENPYLDKNMVIFEFEKVVAPGKDGKDEEQYLYINTPGTYSFTIPAGCIKSDDGEEFAEQTFTFSVVGTFPINNYSPVETEDTIKNIVLTFDKEVTKVVLPEYPLTVCDVNNYWAAVATVTDAAISEDKKSVTLMLSDSISAPSQYTLNIYEGVIITADGVNASKELYFTIIDTKPSFSTSYQDGDRVKEISNVLEITFKNVTEVKPAEGENAPKITVYPPSGAEIVGTATCENNKITVTFDGMPTKLESGKTEGDFLFFIPAGAFTMDGVANESREITVTLYSLDITPLKVVSVTPEAGSIAQIEEIRITFNQPVQLYYDKDGRTISQEIKLTCGDKEYTLSNAYSNDLSTLIYTTAQWDGYDWVSSPITEAGTYTLNLADIIVNYAAEDGIDEWGYPAKIWHAQNQHCEGTYTWTIGAGEGIEATEAANGEQAIYDLLGRRVEKITGAGIYIVNGKKMVVK